MIALMLLFACKDEPKIDEEGCWLDGEEAYLAVLEGTCTATGGCHPEFGEEAVQGCIDQGRADLEYFRDELCFDGCTVNRCLDLIAAYRDECTDEAGHDYYFCYEETFYDGLEKACVTRPW